MVMQQIAILFWWTANGSQRRSLHLCSLLNENISPSPALFLSSCPQMESQLCSLLFDLWITVWEEAWRYCIFIYSQCWSLNIPLILLNSPKLALLFFNELLHLGSSVVRDPLGEAVGCHERFLRLTPAWPAGEVADDIKGVDMAEVVIDNHKIALRSDMPWAKDHFDCILTGCQYNNTATDSH